MRLVMLGPPGAGKGTQAQVLQQRYGAVQLSTGDILRRHRTEGTKLGKEAQSYMDRGALVPDELIIAMVEDELSTHKSFILDGFPRTIPQAQALDTLLSRLNLPLDAVLVFDADRTVLTERLSARWTNPRNGRIYNTLSKPPKVAGMDDEDGGPLVQRPDDQPATVAHRLDVYDAQTRPLVEYYEQRGTARRINALAPIDEVTAQIVACFQPVSAGEGRR